MGRRYPCSVRLQGLPVGRCPTGMRRRGMSGRTVASFPTRARPGLMPPVGAQSAFSPNCWIRSLKKALSSATVRVKASVPW